MLNKSICYLCVAFVFAFAFMYPMRNSVLGKLIMVAVVVAMTMCHRIAGVVALIFVIALLNRGIIEGMNGLSSIGSGTAGSSSSSSSSNPLLGGVSTATVAPAATPAQFRQQYCTKGVVLTDTNNLKYEYILSPTLFSDDKGTPALNKTDKFMVVAQNMNAESFNSCTPEVNPKGGQIYQTFNNMCDPNCNWSMKPATTSEGFTPMARPHIRAGNKIVAKGIEQFKSAANRIKRTLFAN